MVSINIGKKLPISKELIDSKIRNCIPMGFNVNNKESLNMEKAFPWKKVNETAHKFTLAFGRKLLIGTVISGIGTVISGFLRFWVKIRFFPRTMTFYSPNN